MITTELREIIKEGLSHISTHPAKIAEDEICRRLNLFFESHLKDLQHFQDCHIGLWATDKEPEDKENFFQITK